MVPRLALVPGEPAGIGPELCIRAAQTLRNDAHLIAYADPAVLQRAADVVRLPLRILPAEVQATQPGDLPCVSFPCAVLPAFGTPHPRNARSVIDALTQAARDCMDGICDGMVTGPVQKSVIDAGGIPYTGTTELLAGIAGCDVVMMLAHDTLRVALATTHLPLRAVPDAITHALLTRVLQITHDALRTRFGIAQSRILVLGLNPHAGEDGLLGDEEQRVITPVLEALRAQGMQLEGPLPADTAFLPHRLQQADAVLAMYHDQGLPVLKYSGFERAMNITLGLPFPRVAVDHGTALDLAGSGRADPASLLAAIAQCTRMAATGTPS